MEEPRIEAPFTDEQVLNINMFQNDGRFHPFTCCSPEEITECTRAGRMVDGEYVQGISQGLLVAYNDGMLCPCGEYKQTWVYQSMADSTIKK